MADFKMIVTDIPGGSIIKLIGSLDVPACTSIERNLMVASARKDKLVVFDLSELTFICSLGMGALVSFRGGAVRGGGRVFLAAMTPLVLECFRRPRLTALFEVRDAVAECLPPA